MCPYHPDAYSLIKGCLELLARHEPRRLEDMDAEEQREVSSRQQQAGVWQSAAELLLQRAAPQRILSAYLAVF